MINRNFVFLLGFLTLFVGCGKNETVVTSIPQSGVISDPVDLQNSGGNCELNAAQVQLTGEVISFTGVAEPGSGFSFNIGYNGFGNDFNRTPISGGVNVKISTAKMDFQMSAADGMTGTTQLATASVAAKQTITDIQGTINFGQLIANPSYYSSTDLAKVSLKALNLALADLKKELDGRDWKINWSGRVLKEIPETGVLINVGSKAGAMLGDTFEIYNLQHYWAGQPCVSQYLGAFHSPSDPVAVIQITQVNEVQSLGKLISRVSSPFIGEGADVKIKQLANPPKGTSRYIKKRAIIGLIKASSFQVPGGSTFDLQKALNSQVAAAIDSLGAFVFDIRN